MKIEDRILERLAIGKGYPNVYWIGRKAVRLTFLSQQQRALNLIWALHKTRSLGPSKRVTIVGAGLAGLTAAVAAKKVGAEVTIVEAKDDPLHLQRGCQLRFVHPHILDWPDHRANDPLTDLPCLNWGAGMAAKVANTVYEQWAALRENIIERYGHEVRDLRRTKEDRPVIFAEGKDRNYQEECDCLILAVGFGLEKSVPGTPFLSYWDNDNFGRAIISGTVPRRYLISGCGDGGLIDAIRLCIRAFDHAEFVYNLSNIAGLDKCKNELLEIDERVALDTARSVKIDEQLEMQLELARKKNSSFDESRARSLILADLQGEFLEEAYRNLSIPKELTELLTRELRRDTIVCLNSTGKSPFSLTASILNRFVVFLLRRYGKLKYRPGELEVLPAILGQPIVARFRTTDFPVEDLVVDEIVIRHGPIPAIERLLPATVAAECRPDARDLIEDPTREPQYPTEFLAEPDLLLSKQRVRLDYAILSSPLAARTAFEISSFDRFGVQIGDDGVAYVLRTRHSENSADRPQIPDFYGFPFVIDLPAKSSTEKEALRSPHDRVQDAFLVPGIAIRKLGSDSVIGTLGCFVQLKSGEHGMLTTASALGPSVQVGDHIECLTDSWHDVATVSYLIRAEPSTPKSSLGDGTVRLNRVDAAVATLRDEIPIRAGFDNTFLGTAAMTGVVPVSNVLLGAKVFKVGARTGLTDGLIGGLAATVTVAAGDAQNWYEDLLVIMSPRGTFAAPGDGGAAIILADGRVVGLLLAVMMQLQGGGQIVYACPIETVLAACECELLTS